MPALPAQPAQEARAVRRTSSRVIVAPFAWLGVEASASCMLRGDYTTSIAGVSGEGAELVSGFMVILKNQQGVGTGGGGSSSAG